MEANHFVCQLYILFFVSLICLSNWIDVFMLVLAWKCITGCDFFERINIYLSNFIKMSLFSFDTHRLLLSDRKNSRFFLDVIWSLMNQFQDLISFFRQYQTKCAICTKNLKNKHISSLKSCTILSLCLDFFYKINPIRLYHSK